MAQPGKFEKYILLEELLNNKSAVLSVAHIIYLVREAGAGLDQSHHNLSPQNILISSAGHIKIINSAASATNSITALGTILSELLSKTASTEIPMNLNHIIIKALANDKNHRYQSATVLCQELTELLNLEYPDFSAQQFGNFIKIFFAESHPKNKSAAKSSKAVAFEPINDYETAPSTAIAAHDAQTKSIPDGFISNTDSAANSEPDLPAQPSNELNFEALQKTALTKPLRNHENEEIYIKAARYNHTHFSKKAVPVDDPVGYQEDDSRFGSLFKLTAVVSALALFIFIADDDFNKSLKRSPHFSKLFRLFNINTTKNVDLTEQSSQSAAPTKATSKPVEQIKPIIVGYANITVSEPSPHVRVYINGIELLDRPPVFKFPLISNTQNVISAYNVVTKKYAEQRLIVKPKQSVQVRLVLKHATKRKLAESRR